MDDRYFFIQILRFIFRRLDTMRFIRAFKQPLLIETNDGVAVPSFLPVKQRARLYGSRSLLLAAASALAMTPFAVEAWTLELSPASVSTSESGEGASIAVNVTAEYGNFGDCTVSGTVVASGGTATEGSDYSISNGAFSIDIPFDTTGATSSPIFINITDDSLVESTETVNLTIQNYTNCIGEGTESVRLGGSATVNISDNDTAPTPNNPTPNLTLDPDFTPNQRSVYYGLQSACENASGELLERCGEITNADLDSIIPDEISSQGTEAVDFGFKQFSIIHGRIVNLRNSQKQNTTLLGYSTININGETIPVGKALASLGSALGGAAGDDPTAEPLRDSPLGFFIKGQFNVGDKQRTRNEQGFKTDRKAFTFGLDYSLTDDFILGAAFGYGATENNYFAGSGRMETDAFEFSTYGSYFLPSDYYVDWVLSYALHSFDSTRRIKLASFDTTADSSPEGDQYGVSLGFGKDIAIQEFIINPYIRLEYLNTSVNKFRESGGGGLALEFANQLIESASTTLGGQASRAISTPWGIVSPSLRFEWVHQYMDDSRLIQARFSQAVAGTGTFSVLTDNPDRDYFNLGGSVAVNLTEGRAGYLRYEYRLGQSQITDHTVELGARIPF